MKKLIMMAIVSLLLFPTNTKAQDDGIVAAATGILAIGSAIAAVEQVKERLELRAVEYVLNEYPDLVEFELTTSSLNGTKFKDLSSVSVVSFELTDNNSKEKSVLFAFTSNDWVNQYGVDFSKIMWKNFKKEEWNNLVSEFVKMVSGQEISILHLAEKIKQILDYSGSLVFNDKIPDGNPRKLLDSSLINSYGWKPITNLQTGLENTYKWYLENN